jgi:hypothetical protein
MVSMSSISSQQLSTSFELIAKTITEEYITEFRHQLQTTQRHYTFAEVLEKVKVLTDDLTYRASWFRADYSEVKGRKSPRLTKACKKIITGCMHHYLNSVKLLERMERNNLIDSYSENNRFLLN